MSEYTHDTAEPKVRKFDYKIEVTDNQSSELGFLQKLGAEGWELAAAVPGNSGTCKYVLKKELFLRGPILN